MADNTARTESGDRTSFGYREVSIDEKKSLVYEVFNSVAPKYDLMNDLMSGGIHRRWKSNLIRAIRPHGSQVVLDVGGGTGDIALGVLAKAGCNVMVLDINTEMLSVGQGRALDRGHIEPPFWTCGDAERLPVSDSSVDVYVTSFCLRNVPNLFSAVQEARRVLKPGGHFLCLEFSKFVLPILSDIYDFYSFRVLPSLGYLIAGDRESYQYLAESIRCFPDQEAFSQIIRDAGLEQVRYKNVSAGIAAIHSAWRL